MDTPKFKDTRSVGFCQEGFALIATISVMVLLVMIALAVLSLSTIELRSSRDGAAMDEAKANARMALMIALGELQKYSGPDQRVTVPASQWDSNPATEEIEGVVHPRLLAVYQARSMEDEMSNTLPSDYYDKSHYFLTWLVSSADSRSLENSDFAEDGHFDDEVTLTPHRDSEMTLRAGRVPVSSGAYAWGISDESLKYSLRANLKTKQKNDVSVASVMARSGLLGMDGHDIIADLGKLDKEGTELEKYITPNQISLIKEITGDRENLDEYLTPQSLSLLTDVKRGGFKRCLNMLLELDEADLPEEYLKIENYSSRWGGSRPLNQRKFSDESLTGSSESTAHDTLPVSLLQRYYQTARMSSGAVTANTNDSTNVKLQSGRSSLRLIANKDDPLADRYWAGYGHSLRLVPVITRARDIIYVRAVPVPTDPSKLELEFMSFPVLTFWNPYNVDVELPTAWCRSRGHAIEYRVSAGGMTRERRVGGSSTYRFGEAGGKKPLVFAPGETKVLFPDSGSSSYSNVIFTNEWFSNVSQLAKFKTDRTYITGQENTPVDISLFASNDFFNQTWKSSQHFDGWMHDSINYWSGTKFHNWAFKLDQYRNILTGGEDILKGKTFGSLKDTPWPLAIVELGTKSADHAEQPGLLWTFDYPHRMNLTPHYAAAEEDVQAGRQASPMQYSFTPLRGDTDLSKHLHVIDGEGGMHDVMGYSKNPSRGASHMVLCELPFVPLHSLGQLQHLPLQDIGWYHDSIHPHSPTWTFGIGNSWAHPWLSSSVLTENRGFALNAKGDTTNLVKGYIPMTDRLWAGNALMWDSYTFTTMAPQDAPWFQTAGSSRDLSTVYDDFFQAYQSLPNDRLIPWPGTDAEELEARVVSSSKPTQDAYKILPAHLGLLGGVNVNNTSVEVWKLLLASTLNSKIPTQSYLPGRKMKVTKSDHYFVSRFTQPTGPSIDHGGDAYVDGFNGHRELSKTDIEDLAEAIVVEIKKRGPFRSFAEFVNRQRISSSSEAKAIFGALQAALESETVSINEEYSGETFKSSDFPDVRFTNQDAVDGPNGSGMPRARGIPGYVTQADLLTPLAPVMTARGDTFTIHAYGESVDRNGRVIARARCKAVVQRCPEFVDPGDVSEIDLRDLSQDVNLVFGRKFKMVSFQWLPGNDV